jgi:type IV secretory pathway protease TraF
MRLGSHLRLAAFNPEVSPGRAATRGALVLLPPPTVAAVAQARAGRVPPRIDLAVAIAAHLAGEDGLTGEEFVSLFALGRLPGAC